MFDVGGRSDATGHFDIWDGSQIRYHSYWDEAHSIYLWICD